MKPKTIYKKDKKMSLEEMQQKVGGYIEIAYDDGETQIICNEEGKLIGLPINEEATYLWEKVLGYSPVDVLVGDCLILTEKARLV